MAVGALKTVQSDLYSVSHIFGGESRLILGEFGGAALDSLLINDRSVHHGLIENAFCFSESHVDEIVAFDCNLGLSVGWSALRVNRVNNWSLVIEVVNLFTGKFIAITLVCH